MKRMITKIFALCAAITLLIPAEVSAQSSSDLQVDIGEGIIIDVGDLAIKNGVNPYALKAAIIEGMNSEKASPFSGLQTMVPNTMASESVILPFDGNAKAIAKKTNQDSTAYVAASGALTASGKTPTIGMCAMHTDVTTKTGTTSSSIVRLGTKIYMDDFVNVNGSSLSSFTVEDRGKPSGRTSFWIDIFFGENTTSNYNAAIQYGVKNVSYSYIY